MKQAKWAIVLGAVIFGYGLLYHTWSLGIAWGDDQWKERELFHSMLSMYIYTFGSITFLAGLLAFAFYYLKGKWRRYKEHLKEGDP